MQTLHKKNNFYFLSKKQTGLLRAFAIIIIVLHNYVKYLLPGFPIGENEFSFSSSYFMSYLDFFIDKPYFIIEVLLTFWGHYGVQIFIFISAFGLTKMFNNYTCSSIFKYYFKYYVKLTFLLIFGLMICIPLSYNLDIYGSRLDFVKIYSSPLNLLFFGETRSNLGFMVGSWWYFGLAFQLYIIFPILYFIIKKYNRIGFIFFIILYLTLSYLMLYSADSEVIVKFQKSILGHFPEVLLGVALAREKAIKLSKPIFFISIIVFLLSNIYKFLFPFSFISALIVLLVICRPLIFFEKVYGNRVLLYIGSISMILFLVNSVCRIYAYRFLPTIPILSMIIYFIALLIFSSIAYFIFKLTFLKLECWLFKKIKLYK